MFFGQIFDFLQPDKCDFNTYNSPDLGKILQYFYNKF